MPQTLEFDPMVVGKRWLNREMLKQNPWLVAGT